MADEETQAEWKKSKRIEAERQKAMRAVEREGQSKADLAYLDPGATKVKGFSRDPNVILADAERMANRAAILVIGGVVLRIIGDVGGIVSTSFNLGLAGVILDIPGWVGLACLGVGVLMAMAVIGCEIYFKVKMGRRISSALWSAVAVLAIVVIYFVIRWLIIRFN